MNLTKKQTEEVLSNFLDKENGLNDVMQMMLNAMPTSPIELRCGEIPLFVGSMGQKGGNMAVKVDKKLRNM